ncbi:hypothetical protein [Photobacterium iliopiscarium]|jgi:hypothetical protein|uniref:Uncharacterized protein n=1 Tax=Photobacterium iliopiscarium TaxID=56192 RepID=A0A2T3ML26_9GAMM|nr:hypothetical protein [Photobacterium iliopiscarium]MCD9467864.1 hypothetical protein [Photobacterium iliopiscarium]MCD9487569.1 hypothetical protein [Photobacterium iliopiscarium]MCF2244257.1 hypothetical protein [Photobacterium iliopiscarium]PST96175.1 hypothetical protein C9I87_06445 [Photobacterium iliopiscarium]PSU01023.1 hypothetical protein C9I85_06010 [Photobacterium iliopiscarium]
MDKNQRIRSNITNYDVLRAVKAEVKLSEARITRRIYTVAILSVATIIFVLMLIITSQTPTTRDYAAEAMKRSFEAERSVKMIDETLNERILKQEKSNE